MAHAEGCLLVAVLPLLNAVAIRKAEDQVEEGPLLLLLLLLLLRPLVVLLLTMQRLQRLLVGPGDRGLAVRSAARIGTHSL